jgi:hypothetical protein
MKATPVQRTIGLSVRSMPAASETITPAVATGSARSTEVRE